MRPRIALAAAALGWVTACSGDLFHSTDWTPRCAGDGCGGSSDGGAGALGGEGGSGATGTGGVGAAGGEGGIGGADGGAGGAGGSPGCLTCFQAVFGGTADQVFCPMSADLYDAVINCVCAQNACPIECVDNLCENGPASSRCAACASGTCSALADACASDVGD